MNRIDKFLLPFLTLLPSASHALCDFNVSTIHRHCKYYASSTVEANEICLEKVEELVQEGYRSSPCFGNGEISSAGWFTSATDWSNKYPFQFITVFVTNNCEDGELEQETGVCSTRPDKNLGPEACVGNPCNAATGNKFQSEIDFSSGGLRFVRVYNSKNLTDLGLGKGWQHNYQQRLILGEDSIIQVSSTGRGEPWQRISGSWQGDADSNLLLVETESGYDATYPTGDVEKYDTQGRILLKIDTKGRQTTYLYDSTNPDQLNRVTDHYGTSLDFSYQDGRLQSVTDALGNQYSYNYDSNDNLSSVQFPQSTEDSGVAPTKSYHYENSSLPNHLTGITDENGNRYATWAYDTEGRATSTEHAQTTNAAGQEKFSLDFQD